MTDWSDEPAPIRELLEEGVDCENTIGVEPRLRRLEVAVIEAFRRDATTPDGGATAAQQELDGLRERVADLESQVEQLSGLADGEQSTPAKRAVDVCLGLANVAEERDTGRAQWDYDDIVTFLEGNGHGRIHPPQAYDVMDRLDEIDGFAKTSDEDDNYVLRCKSAAVNAEAAVNEINNGPGECRGQNTAQTGVNTSRP